MSSHIPENFPYKAVAARRRAARSRLVMRVCVLVAVGLGLAFVAQSLLRPKPAVSVEAVVTATPLPKVVAAGYSTFSGIDVNAKPFSVKALDGVQDGQVETLMHLKTVVGIFVRKGGGDVQVDADKADYDVKTKDLKVTGNVRFEEPGRYVAKLASAEVNLERQRISTNEPVQVSTAGATVAADSMETTEDGRVVTLRGHVQAHFTTDVPELKN